MYPRQVYWLAAILAGIAIAIFIYKVFIVKLPLKPDTTVDVWDIDMRITFEAQKKPVKVSLYLPQSRGRFEILDEHFISGEYGLAIQRFSDARKAIWSVRYANGKQYLLYKATVHPELKSLSQMPVKPPKLKAPTYEGANLVAATHVFNSIKKHSADDQTLVSLLLSELAKSARDENINLLLANDNSPVNRGLVAKGILSVGGIPAHVVHGIELKPLARNAKRVSWFEAYYKGAWHEFSLADGGPSVPEHYLAWWRDNKPLVTLEGGQTLHSKISITVNPQVALQQHLYLSRHAQSKLLEYSLLNLPVETQNLYHVILMVPIGVIFLVLMRNLIGVKTFGTFMPILIALAFRETKLEWGISLFVIVVGLGLTIRFYFDRLKLLLVPRLASVLIVVIMLMAAVSILSYKLGLPNGLSIALFPMVIMTMTIERMSIVWEERGAMESLQQGFGSLLVASIAYILMNLEFLQHFIFVFPEMLLLLLAVTLLLGRYSGYRLTELSRFKVLSETEKR